MSSINQNALNNNASNHQVETLNREIENLKYKLAMANQLLESFSDRETDLQRRENELRRQEVSLLKKQEEFRQKYDELKHHVDDYNISKQSLMDREKKLQVLQEKNEQRASELTRKEHELQSELSQKRQDLYDELNKIHQDELSQLTNLESKRQAELTQNIQKEYEEHLQRCEMEFSQLRQKLIDDRNQLEKDKQSYENEKGKLDNFSKRLDDRESHIEEEVRTRSADEIKNLKNLLEESQLSNERLRESIKGLASDKNIFADLESRLNGQDPLKVLTELEEQKTIIRNLQEELRERPSKEVQDSFNLLQAEKQRLLDENLSLKEENLQLQALENDFQNLEFQKDRAESRARDKESELNYANAQINKLQEEISLLSKPFGAEQNRQQRIESLLVPPQIQLKESVSFYNEDTVENEWLDNIYHQCLEIGFVFPKRILNAFHTSLKTGELSPITVLAGVSGTGKSQLPALYSKFGGINFINVPVQPNWDSQEAMLGYFNSMTNHFDAQPVLKFLMQTQQDRDESYPNGLKDMMNLILLDEMNLSHPELYFAEFLSKLEERRGKSKVPTIDINLGSGIAGYGLPLRRNVMWVGTMNQDETTKSLSDKVIDRSFVINFPRPRKLKDLNIKKMANINTKTQHMYMGYRLWHSWVKYESLFNTKQVKEYKFIIEQINDYMDRAGRALGHRVWQSVEYYMSNHPDVIIANKANDEDRLKESMRIAFEDQLVQKVMPKLRGIETRGQASKNCLEPIQNLLDSHNYKIVDDFKHAREVGHGQFIWSSAYYLEDDITESE